MPSVLGTLSVQKKQSKKYQAGEPGLASWSKIELKNRIRRRDCQLMQKSLQSMAIDWKTLSI